MAALVRIAFGSGFLGYKTYLVLVILSFGYELPSALVAARCKLCWVQFVLVVFAVFCLGCDLPYCASCIWMLVVLVGYCFLITCCLALPCLPLVC